MSNQIGDGPIQPEYIEQMKTLAKALDSYFNGIAVAEVGKGRHIGFVLMVFPFGEDPKGRTNYISNADRKDVIVLLKEQLSYFEGMPSGKGRA